jgi:adenylate cyclase
MQAGVAERQADQPDDRRIVFRIGINIGDVIIEDDDIYGDGVNVAARLEQLAKPGSICITNLSTTRSRIRISGGVRDDGSAAAQEHP